MISKEGMGLLAKHIFDLYPYLLCKVEHRFVTHVIQIEDMLCKYGMGYFARHGLQFYGISSMPHYLHTRRVSTSLQIFDLYAMLCNPILRKPLARGCLWHGMLAHQRFVSAASRDKQEL